VVGAAVELVVAAREMQYEVKDARGISVAISLVQDGQQT
jgi:hypothetical protein